MCSSWSRTQGSTPRRAAGGSLTLRAQRPATRHCTRPAFPAMGPRKIMTTSSPVTHANALRLRSEDPHKINSVGTRSPRLLRLRGVLLVGDVDAVGVVVGGHVGEDDFVAFFESVEDLDGVYGGAAKFYVDADGFGAVIANFEQRECGIAPGAFAGVNRAMDGENVIELFDVDGGVDWEIDSDSLGQRTIEGNIQTNRSAYDFRTDAADMALHDAPRVHRGKDDCASHGGILTGLHLLCHEFR